VDNVGLTPLTTHLSILPYLTSGVTKLAACLNVSLLKLLSLRIDKLNPEFAFAIVARRQYR
jgi:hypothetical protein